MLTPEFVANSIATLVLAAMMFIPLVNVLVGAIVGGNFAGLAGLVAGCLTAAAITCAQIVLTRGPRAAAGTADVSTEPPTASHAGSVVDLGPHLQNEEQAAERPEELPRAA